MTEQILYPFFFIISILLLFICFFAIIYFLFFYNAARRRADTCSAILKSQSHYTARHVVGWTTKRDLYTHCIIYELYLVYIESQRDTPRSVVEVRNFFDRPSPVYFYSIRSQGSPTRGPRVDSGPFSVSNRPTKTTDLLKIIIVWFSAKN